MRRLTLPAAALLLVAVSCWTLATWAVAANSRAWFEDGLRRTEALLQRFSGGKPLRVRLESFEEGTLTSRARTSWTAGDPVDRASLPLVHEIGHGPDWSPGGGFRVWRVETRIDRERLPPRDREQLTRAFGDADPFLFELATADGSTFTGRVRLAPGELRSSPSSVSFDPFSVDFVLVPGADGALSGEFRGRVGEIRTRAGDAGGHLRLLPFDFEGRFAVADPCPGGWLSGESAVGLQGFGIETASREDPFVLRVRELRFENRLETPPRRSGGSLWRLRADLAAFVAGDTAFADLTVAAELAVEPLLRRVVVGVCELADLAGRDGPEVEALEARLLALFEDLAEGPSGLRFGLEIADKGERPHRLAADLGWPQGPRPATLGELARRARGRLELDFGLESASSPELQQILVMPVALGLARIEGARVRGDVRLAHGILHLPAGPKPVDELLGPLARQELDFRSGGIRRGGP